MDIFIEQLVKRKPGPQDYLIAVGAVLLGILLVFLSVALCPPLVLFVLAGACYGCYVLITSRSVEFEYSVTNGDITIDKIIYRRKRKRVISVDARTVEEFGKYDSKTPGTGKCGARIFSSEAWNGEGAWYFRARHPQMGNVTVIFSPDVKTLEAIRPFLPRQVEKDAFDRY